MLPFADAYLAGRTPLPCATCNSRFKFDRLLARALALGAERVATGHYARVGRDAGVGASDPVGRADAGKDQSYFLFGLAPAQLERACFPLGELSKGEVRARARALGLATADKAESQELCFVPDGDTGSAVERLRPERAPGPGEIVDESGRVLGSHAGVHRYTVGQRRGLGVGAAAPLYVKALDAARNRVVVTNERGLESSAGRVAQVSWISGAAPRDPFDATVRIRYRHEGALARVTPNADGSAALAFDEPVRALAPGRPRCSIGAIRCSAEGGSRDPPHERARTRRRARAAARPHLLRPELLATALTHASAAFERDGSRGNERLEFLGDAVLGLVVARLLYESHPDWREGELTRARAALVNGHVLARQAQGLGLADYLVLGRTERRSGGAEKERVLANVFEAVIGAIYLDGGIEPVRALVSRCFGEALLDEATLQRDPRPACRSGRTPRCRTRRAMRR